MSTPSSSLSSSSVSPKGVVKSILKTGATQALQREQTCRSNLEYSSSMITFKIVICGSKGSGKSSIVKALSGEKVFKSYVPTVGIETTTMLAASYKVCAVIASG